MPRTYVKPREGGRVRMPERNSMVMPPEGAWIEVSDYYQRLLLAEDIEPTPPPSAPPVTDAPPQAVGETPEVQQADGAPSPSKKPAAK